MKTDCVCVVGAGYVGLPLAFEFSKHFITYVFDTNKEKIEDLRLGKDPTNQFGKEDVLSSGVKFTSNPSEIALADFVVVAVPTPIDKSKKPDLSYIESASEIVGRNLKKGAIVVFESTVYPGVTEEVCVPILEKSSDLKCGVGFKVGYSPERVNPGDKEHTIDKIVKIISAMDDESLREMELVYGKIIKAGLFKAKNIKTAEAAKVIENTQRDLNIALVNELALIFDRMGLDTSEVLEAASSKWNFHRYRPGLVGGHCISVDPHYLLYKAEELGYHPKVILAGRDINDYMSKFVAESVVKSLSKAGKVLNNCKVLVLGLTFKEDINDTRNSKVKDVIAELDSYGINTFAFDPMLEHKHVREEFGDINFITSLNGMKNFDAVVLAVAHSGFKGLTLNYLKSIMSVSPVLVDLKSFYNKEEAEKLGFIYKRL